MKVDEKMRSVWMNDDYAAAALSISACVLVLRDKAWIPCCNSSFRRLYTRRCRCIMDYGTTRGEEGDQISPVCYSQLVPWSLPFLQTLQTQWWYFIIKNISLESTVLPYSSYYRKWVSLLVLPLMAAWPACKWLSLTISRLEGLRASVIWWTTVLGDLCVVKWVSNIYLIFNRELNGSFSCHGRGARSIGAAGFPQQGNGGIWFNSSQQALNPTHIILPFIPIPPLFLFLVR